MPEAGPLPEQRERRPGKGRSDARARTARAPPEGETTKGPAAMRADVGRIRGFFFGAAPRWGKPKVRRGTARGEHRRRSGDSRDGEERRQGATWGWGTVCHD
jgi:hypothetical protein